MPLNFRILKRKYIMSPKQPLQQKWAQDSSVDYFFQEKKK